MFKPEDFGDLSVTLGEGAAFSNLTSRKENPDPVPSLEEIENALLRLLEGRGGSVDLSIAASRLAKRFPGFRPSLFGCSKLSSLIQQKMSGRVTFIPAREDQQPMIALSPSDKSAEVPSLGKVEEEIAAFLQEHNGKADLSDVAQRLLQRFPGFKPSLFGCGKLRSLIQQKMDGWLTFIPGGEGRQAEVLLKRAGGMASQDEKDFTTPERENPVDMASVQEERERSPESPRVCFRKDLVRSLASMTSNQFDAADLQGLCEKALADGRALRSGDDAVIDTGMTDRQGAIVYAWLERTGDNGESQEWDLRSFCRRGHGFYGERLDQKFPLKEEKKKTFFQENALREEKLLEAADSALSDQGTGDAGISPEKGRELLLASGSQQSNSEAFQAESDSTAQSCGESLPEAETEASSRSNEDRLSLSEREKKHTEAACPLESDRIVDFADSETAAQEINGSAEYALRENMEAGDPAPEEAEKDAEDSAGGTGIPLISAFSQTQQDPAEQTLPSLQELRIIMIQLIEAAPGGRMTLSELSMALKERIPGFRPSHYGCSKMISLLTRKMNGVVSLKKDRRHDLTYVTKSPCGVPTEEVQAVLAEQSSIRNGAHISPRPSPAVLPPTVLGSFSIVKEGHYRDLAALALEEPWHCGSEDDGTFPLLREYMRTLYSRQRQQKRILLSPDRSCAAMNTGLLSRNYEPVYAFFERAGHNAGVQWELKDFCLAGQGQYGKQLVRHFFPLPEAPSSSLDPRDLFYDLKLGIPSMDWTHILVDRVGRIPLDVLRAAGVAVPAGKQFYEISAVRRCQDQLRSDPDAYRRLKALFAAALDLAMMRLQYNFHLAVPVYRTSNQSLGLALPLCLLREDRVDLWLIVERMDSDAYMGHTVYPLEWVYSASRPLFRPSESWLDPRQIEPFVSFAGDFRGNSAEEKNEQQGFSSGFWHSLTRRSTLKESVSLAPEHHHQKEAQNLFGNLRRIIQRLLKGEPGNSV